ncbi:MAG: CopG family ribbon-helix-helix protein [Burkholderiales bacterium]
MYKNFTRSYTMMTKSIPTKFDEHDLNQLNYLAKLYDRPVSYLIREATRTYIQSQAKKLEFLEEARSAANNFEKTGLHSTHPEVKSWLNKLSQGINAERPKCHK